MLFTISQHREKCLVRSSCDAEDLFHGFWSGGRITEGLPSSEINGDDEPWPERPGTET